MTGEKKEKQAVLIGAGENNCKTAEMIKDKLSQGVCIIALDGGLAFCAENGIQPDLIVGDFDSLPDRVTEEIIDSVADRIAEEIIDSVADRVMEDLQAMTTEGVGQGKKEELLLAKYPRKIIFKLPCEKDDTDTLAAIKMAVEKGYTRFTIYGGLGGRLSHTMANIQSLLYLKERGLYGELVGDGSRVFLVKDESVTLPLQEQGYISVFSFDEKAEGVTLKNLKYEVENVELTNSFPIGVSNEFVGQQAEISVKKGILLVIIEEI